MSLAARPPQTSEELRAVILERYEDLSKRLQQIARYVLDEPNAVGLETLAVIGERAGVQPSAIVRFAKAIGFESASQMQKVVRDGLIAEVQTLDDAVRIVDPTGGGASVTRIQPAGRAAELAARVDALVKLEVLGRVGLLTEGEVAEGRARLADGAEPG